MSKLDELIQQYCPDGVEFKSLMELFDIKGGYTPSKKNEEFWNDGNVPWYRIEDIRLKGRILYDSEQHITLKGAKNNPFKKDSIIISTSATIGEFALIKTNFVANQRFTIFSLKAKYKNVLNIEFVLFAFQLVSEWCKNNLVQGNFSSVDMKSLRNFSIPLPPIEIQNEIVRILDQFTELNDVLDSELLARKKQYEYYLNQFFDNTKIENIRLEGLCDIITKQTGFDYSNHIKKSLTLKKSRDSLPYIQTKFFSGKQFNFNTDYYIPIKVAEKFPKIVLDNRCILLSIVGASIGNIGLFPNKNKAFLGGAIGVLKINKNINIDYIYHYLNSARGQNQIRNNIKGTGQASLTIESIRNFTIPFPSLEVQEEIVRILDQYDSLVNDIKIGLPAEIEARQKQYEYYRDKLLTFKELES